MARKLKPLLFPSSQENGGEVNEIETGSGKPNLGFENTKRKQEHGLCYGATLKGEPGFVELRKFCEELPARCNALRWMREREKCWPLENHPS